MTLNLYNTVVDLYCNQYHVDITIALRCLARLCLTLNMLIFLEHVAKTPAVHHFMIKRKSV